MALNVTTPFPVRDASEVSEPRRAAGWLAEALGFSESRAGKVSLIVSELATNLAKHARGGELLVRPLDDGHNEPSGVEVLSLDTGPGIPDLALSRRDGHSTAGSLGNGLGAIERQADFSDIFTLPSGTAILARIWRDAPPPQLAEARVTVGAVHASKTGEDICGDAWSWRVRRQRLVVMVADGLGHGLYAHDAATAAIDTFRAVHEHSPARIVEDTHAALRATRGAAVAVLSADFDHRILRYCGLGNISTTILHASRQSLVSMNGTAGHTSSRLQEFQYPLPSHSVIVMHSDGLGTHWDVNAYPGLRSHDPSIIAGVLYRDFSRRRDDVTVVVAKLRE